LVTESAGGGSEPLLQTLHGNLRGEWQNRVVRQKVSRGTPQSSGKASTGPGDSLRRGRRAGKDRTGGESGKGWSDNP